MSRLALLAFCLSTLSPNLWAQWSPDDQVNTAVVTRSGEQTLAKSSVTSDGGRWVAWFDNSSGNYDVYLQHYDRQGHMLFPSGGMKVSGNPQTNLLGDWDLITDSSDGAVLAFADSRAGADQDIYGYRITSGGQMIWGPLGVTISANNDFEAGPRLAENTIGDFLVVWSDYGATPEIRMQRISAAGIIQLAPNGVVIASEPGESPGFARVVASAQGRVMVSWIRDTALFSSNRHLRAQVFLPTGGAHWPTPVEVHQSYNLPLAYGPELRADNAGGAILCWHGSNPLRLGLYDSYVQHLDRYGVEQLPAGGIELSDAFALNHMDPQAVYHPTSGEIYAFWTEKSTFQTLSGWYAQKISTAGTRAWGPFGKELLPVDSATKKDSSVEVLGDGAVAAMTWSPTGTTGVEEIIATRLDFTGVQVWGAPVSLCRLPSDKSSRLTTSMSEAEEMVVFWEDDRLGNQDLFGQNLLADGTLGPDYLSINVDSISLTAGGTAVLSMDAGSKLAGKSYAMLGSDAGTVPGTSGRGLHFDLNQGTYFQLTVNNPDFRILCGFRGTLDDLGRATAEVYFAPGANPTLAGTILHHAFAVLDPLGAGIFASESEAFTIDP